MNLPEPIPGNDGADRMHGAEQMWAAASEQLDKILAYGNTMLPDMYANAGGNTDDSVIYDWWKAYVQIAEEQGAAIAALTGSDRNGGHDMTILMCCAAITRLMRIEDRMRADTVLAQLDKEITGNDDDHRG